MEYYPIDYWGDTSWYGYLSFYDYLYNELLPDSRIPFFEEYLKHADSNITTLITFNGIAFISRPPIQIYFDEEDRLHNKHGMSVEYGDGWGLHHIHGVFFSPELFDKAFNRKTLMAKEIMGLKNAEQKAVLIQEFGYEKILSELKDVKKIDTQSRSFNHGDKKVVYELIEFSIREDTPSRLLQVQWYEKNRKRKTVLGVPNTIRDAIEAVAWTCYKTKEEWLNDLVMEA
jgi:hypothetical protein